MVWSWVLSGVALTGVWLTGRKMALGFAVGVLNQVLWLWYGVTTGQPGFVASAAAFATVNIRSLMRWRSSPPARTDQPEQGRWPVRMLARVDRMLLGSRGQTQAVAPVQEASRP